MSNLFRSLVFNEVNGDECRKATFAPFVSAMEALAIRQIQERLDEASARWDLVESRLYERALRSEETQSALSLYERELARRDGLRREVQAGEIGRADDLARSEVWLFRSKDALMDLARRRPILTRHPIIYGVVANAKFETSTQAPVEC